MPEQGEDPLLLGPGAPQGGARLPAHCSPFGLRNRRDVCENVAARHGATISVATANAPPPPKPHSGDIASGAVREPKGLRQHWHLGSPHERGRGSPRGHDPRGWWHLLWSG